MTVSDLIKCLSKMDQNMRVVVCYPDCSAENPACEEQFLADGVLYSEECDLEEGQVAEKVVVL